MRRKEREVFDKNEIEKIIHECKCCRVGFNDDGQIYIVPMNFGYSNINDEMTFYFHCAKQGRKIDIVFKNNEVGFELDTNHQIKVANIASECTAYYQSIIGNGKISVIDDINEKIIGLNHIMVQSTKKNEWEYSEKMLNSVCVLKLNVSKITCKQHI